MKIPIPEKCLRGQGFKVFIKLFQGKALKFMKKALQTLKEQHLLIKNYSRSKT